MAGARRQDDVVSRLRIEPVFSEQVGTYFL
jgi:hypothetical protein